MTDRTDRERELSERNAQLTSTLREARDQLVIINDGLKDEERILAIGDALEYAILAVDMRVHECKAAVARGVVGENADRARVLSKGAIERIFETALRTSGYVVTRIAEDGAA